MSVKGKRVLVIDDVADVRLRCRKMLESFKMTVFEAGSSAEGLDLLSRAKPLPDLILLDLQMSGKSGFDFLAARKQSVLISAIPVIVASGLDDKASVARAIALGANDYVLKPLNGTILLLRIRKRLKDGELEELTLPVPSEATIEADASILRFEKTCFTFESPIRMTRGTRVEIPERALKELKLSGVVLTAVSQPGSLTITRGYQTKVEVIGLKSPVGTEKDSK